MPLHNVFISYHHYNDQWAKDHIVEMNELHGIYSERSIRDGDISDDLPTQAIRTKIRDGWLRNSTVTILLVGTETQYRKHVDWELKSSMIDGAVNKRSGILVIMLPSTGCSSFYATCEEEKKAIYPECSYWIALETKADYESYYPNLPERIYDNLMAESVNISVTTWDHVKDSPANLKFLIAHSNFL